MKEAASTNRCGQERLPRWRPDEDKQWPTLLPDCAKRLLSRPAPLWEAGTWGPVFRCAAFAPGGVALDCVEDPLGWCRRCQEAVGSARTTARRVWGRSRHRPGAVAGPASGSRAWRGALYCARGVPGLPVVRCDQWPLHEIIDSLEKQAWMLKLREPGFVLSHPPKPVPTPNLLKPTPAGSATSPRPLPLPLMQVGVRFTQRLCARTYSGWPGAWVRA